MSEAPHIKDDPPIEGDGISRWVSSDLPSRDRLEGYIDRVKSTLFPSALTPMGRDDFRASLEEVRFATGRAARFISTPHTVSRLSREVAKTSEDTVVAGLHISGDARVRVKDIVVDRTRGDMVAIESSTEFTLETSPTSNFSMLSLFFDGSRIDGYAGRSRRQVWKLLKSQPAALTLHSCVNLFGRRLSQRASHAELTAIFNACEAMVAAAFIEDREFVESAGDGRSAVKAGLLIAILDHIDAKICEPGLTPTAVAGSFGISSRYIHKLFQDEGMTFSGFVLDRRLEGVRNILSSAAGSRLSINEVARKWGFNNRATFHRNFKRRFHMTPLQARGKTDLV